MGVVTIFESGYIEAVTLDFEYPSPVKLGFPDGETGDVSVVFENGKTGVFPVSIIQALHPRVKQVNSSGTTATGIFVGFQ